MFMEFAAWGAWMPVLATRLLGPLKMTGKQTGWIYGTLPIACIFAPLVAGQIADKWVDATWILAGCHLLGAFLLFAAVKATTFKPLFWIMMLYSICYAATLPLVNTVLFRHITPENLAGGVFFSQTIPGMDANGGKDIKEWVGFVQGLVFLWAPVAWALIGYLLTFLRSLRKAEGDGTDCLKLAGVLSLVMVVACLAAPATAPSAKIEAAAAKSVAVAKAADASASPEAKAADAKAAEAKPVDGKAAAVKSDKSPLAQTFDFVVARPDYMLFLLASMLVSGMMQFYFLGSAQFMIDSGISGKSVPAAMGMAQAAQAIATMFALGFILTNLGYKWTLTVGAACWLILYSVYIMGKPRWLIVVCQLGHGLAYVMFMIVGQKYAAEVSPTAIGSTMQALIFAATNGVGLVIGTQLAGACMDKFSANGKFQWPKIWSVPFALVAAGAIVFAVGFQAKDLPAKQQPAPDAKAAAATAQAGAAELATQQLAVR
jgi:MFS family permease